MLLAFCVKIFLIAFAVALGIGIMHYVEEVEKRRGESWGLGMHILFFGCFAYFPAVVYVIIWLL